MADGVPPVAETLLQPWFAARGLRPAPFQRVAWAAVEAGVSGLIHAPTGAGKTLAALGGFLPSLLAAPAGTTRLLWITPLRALAADTEQSLAAVLDTLPGRPTLARRTGDVDSAARARQKRKPPAALVTTPESLSLLLSDPSHPERLAALAGIVVDEWHELLGSKRGVQLELCLARLRALNPQLVTLGLSATLGNLEEAMAVLLGPARAPAGRLIRAPDDKAIVVDAPLPPRIEAMPWAGHLGLRRLPEVLRLLAGAKSTLVFTNTRAQAELWFQGLKACWTEAPDQLALHHGSVDAVERLAVEQGLREGRLRCVVATSSLDLGVDFAEVDQVIQIGSPKGVGRLLQRAGRAGHRPGQTSTVHCIATQALELIEIAAARDAVQARAVEARVPRTACLDVLAQHLVTLAIGAPWSAEAMLAELHDTHAYADLSAERFAAVCRLICHGGEALGRYAEFQRVIVDADGRYRIAAPAQATRHRQAIGTITSNGQLSVRLLKGGSLGHVEENFLGRLKPGEAFLFGGRRLALVRIDRTTAWVKLAPDPKASVPQWLGSKLPLSGALSARIRAVLDRPEAYLQHPEVRCVLPLLALQEQLSARPRQDRLLVEHYAADARERQRLALYPFAGRLAHEGLGALIATRLARRCPNSIEYSYNDYGLLLTLAQPVVIDEDLLRAVLDPAGLIADIEHSLNLGELARLRFREVAQIAGLLVQGRPGARKTHRQLTQSSNLLYAVLCEHDPGHVLLDQARREVLEQELELTRLQTVLTELSGQPLQLTTPDRLTPLTLPLWAERIRGGLSNEDWQSRLSHALAALGVG
ncbi:MAG: ligase-associated DNA damage response DEXH box helicase [Xanthomonadales bacterium]|nr:ligase-associated DNA damage response DEXH box helicase [Xanthomonadales bacterium]